MSENNYKNIKNVKTNFEIVDVMTSRCKICFKNVKTSGNTTNLKKHMERNHSALNVFSSIATASTLVPIDHVFIPDSTKNMEIQKEQSEDDPLEFSGTKTTMTFESAVSSPTTSVTTKKKRLIQMPINETFRSIESFSEGGTKYSKLCNALLFMIAKDGLPLSITEKEGFQAYSKVATPLFKLPSRRSITRMLDDKYDMITEVYRNLIDSVQNVTLTADAWTDVLNSKSYLGVTVHFIQNFQLVSVVLDVHPLSERHTADYLREILTKVQNSWNISNSKVVCIVTDGGANIVKASYDLFGEIRHLHCFAHMLNLIPQRAISNVPKLVLLIKKVKQIVTFFKHSITAADMLTKCQHGGCILKLKQEVPTRWNSTYYMMERFRLLAPKISSVLFEIPNGPEMVSTAELNDIKDLLHLLQPFEIITKEVSGQEYITSSKVIPLVHTLENKVGNLEATTEIGQKLQIELKKEIEKRFQNIEFIQLLSIGTLIDPRFKTVHFQKPLAKSNVIQIVNKEIKQMISAENLNVSNSRLNSEENANDNLVDSNSDIWNYHKKVSYLATSQLLESSNSTMEAEFKQYLDLPLIDINNDVLAVWESYKTVFPHLYVVAQKYLSTVSSSVPSERLFSKAGNLITEKRNRISENRISKLCFLQTIPAKYWDL